MILSIHAITGAVLGSNSNSMGQAIFLGIVSHYFLDSIPHVEYKIENILRGDMKMAIKEFSKIFIDLLVSFIVISYLILNNNFDQPALILIGAFFALFPDGLVFLDLCIKNKEKNIFTRFLNTHSIFHKKIHSVISNKIITVPSQIIVVLVLIYQVFK